MLQIDARTGRIVRTVRDGGLGCPCGANLFAVDGTLWERSGIDGDQVAIRDMSTGRIQRVTPAPVGSVDGAVGFGSIWFLRSVLVAKHGRTNVFNVVDRRDELSGSRIATVRLTGDIEGGTIAVGNGAVWVLQPDGTLDRIDAATNKLTGRFATHAKETTILLPTGGYEWICECLYHEVLRYDAKIHTGRTFHFEEQPWHLVDIKRAGGTTLWLMDEQGATLTRIDPKTGKPAQPLGLSGRPSEAVQLGGSIWVAAGSVIDRIKLPGHARTSITLPAGMNATGIAADPPTGRLWVDNSYPPPRS
jgi:streptogramin lyase